MAEKRKVTYDLSSLSGPELQRFKQDMTAKAEKFGGMLNQATGLLRQQLREELDEVLAKLMEVRREATRRAEGTKLKLPSAAEMEAIAIGIGRIAAEQAQRGRDGFLAYVAEALNSDKPAPPKDSAP